MESLADVVQVLVGTALAAILFFVFISISAKFLDLCVRFFDWLIGRQDG